MSPVAQRASGAVVRRDVRARPAISRPPRRETTTAPARRVLSLSPRGRILAVVVAVVSLFSLAGVQAQLVSGQKQLDRLDAQVAEKRTRNEQLRARAEELSAPERIVTTAKELGMVEPERVTYLVAPSTTAESVAAAAAGSPR